jgi:hypothetical protein
MGVLQMKLIELFLTETTEEDRAIISLSSAIYSLVKEYRDDEDDDIYIGKIGELLDTPLHILNNVSIELKSAELMSPGTAVDADIGRWHEDIATIFLNKDEIDTNFFRTTLSHELRHALDDYKSGNKTSADIGRHTKPKNKEFRNVKSHPTLGNVGYFAQPIELNARYVQVMDDMVPLIKQAVATLSPIKVRPAVMKSLKHLLLQYEISQIFPEGTESPDYKRLIKRAVDFIDKEIAHLTK